jgi:7-cyano-7-deazaguanine synthase in queuosine biosynthesis
MRLICGPAGFQLPTTRKALRTVLYAQRENAAQACAGEAARRYLVRRHLQVDPCAWDFLSIALSVLTADNAVSRSESPDGWTREIELDIAVANPALWNDRAMLLIDALAFLTTDRWTLRFHPGGANPPAVTTPQTIEADSVVLLSGGLDSLVGVIDLVSKGRHPLAISQTVRGDAAKQVNFADALELPHLQLNHAVKTPKPKEDSQRARSIIFVAFAVVGATTLKRYHAGKRVSLYVCENGFIAINPPLTGGRLGSLSTRTAHPVYLHRIQQLLDALGLRIDIRNPYAARTKGEMLQDCQDFALLKAHAVQSTSCGRFQRFNYQHCGRCVPCQVRRAAFLARPGLKDTTHYVYDPLGRPDVDHARFDDVRSVALAIAGVEAVGLETWLGHALPSSIPTNRTALMSMLGRGLDELRALHRKLKVR